MVPSASYASVSPMLSSGSGSSSATVPVAVPSRIVAPTGPARRSQNVSVFSSKESPGNGTDTVAAVARAANLDVPDTAV